MADPVSPAAGQNIDKTFWDAEVYSRWVELYAPWTSYTPVWTSTGGTTSVGNGSLTGKYLKIGKTVSFYIRLVYGSTTTSTGTVWFFTLPFTPLLNDIGMARGGNSGGTPLIAVLQTAGLVFFARHDGTSVNPTVPGTWANGHSLTARGTYEIA